MAVQTVKALLSMVWLLVSAVNQKYMGTMGTDTGRFRQFKNECIFEIHFFLQPTRPITR